MALIKRKHATLKAYVHDWLEPDEPGGVNFFSGLIIALVLVSLASLAIETEAIRPDTPFAPWVRELVQWINGTVVAVFAIEFSLRFWSEGENPMHKGAAGRLRFLKQPIAIADVFAFFPELIVLLFFPQADANWLASLRALRLFRLFKLARYVPAFAIVGAAVKRAAAPLMAALCVAAALALSACSMFQSGDRQRGQSRADDNPGGGISVFGGGGGRDRPMR